MPRQRFLWGAFAVAMAAMLAGTLQHRIGRPTVSTAADQRFRRVIYRQDELLDVPVLAEAFRIAKARCLVGDCTQTDDQTYQSLFSEGFFVLEQAQNITVVFSRQRSLPMPHSWTTPRVVRTTAFSWWDESRTMEDEDGTVEFQTPALTMTFAKVGDRLTSTGFINATDKGKSGLSLGDDFVSLTFYPMHMDRPRTVNVHTVAERMANANRVLEAMRQDAIAADPDAPQLKTHTILNWLPSYHPCGCTGQTWVDGLGNRRVDIDITALMEFSDNRLRRLFGHELGHIARCMDSDAKCQNAAEAHALKLMGPERYRRAHTIADHASEEAASALIAKLDAVNKQYPGK